MSMRKDLAAYLEQLVAEIEPLKDIKVVDSTRALGEITRTTLVVKTDRYEKLPEAPQKRQGRFILTLISKHQDIDRAEDDLDDRLEVLLPALTTSGLIWTSAAQVGYGDSNLAYDITITSILTSKE